MENYNALVIASLTPKEIEAGDHSPKEIFDLMVSGDSISEEKIKSLFARQDVKGKIAFDILKKTAKKNQYSNTKEFRVVSDLYIRKFIKRQNRRNSLIYTVLTIQLWFHDIGSAENLKREESNMRKRVLGAMLLSFFNRWPEYRKNTDLLIQDLRSIFGRYYNEKFCFPGDTEPPFHFSHNDFVYQEVRSYVFPFLGEALRYLSQKGEACVSPESALPLVTNDLIGDNNWMFYLEKISQEFVIDDLKKFNHQSLEEFFTGKKDNAIYQRLRKLCQEQKATEIFELFNFKHEFAGISLSENQEYANLLLREKIDFLMIKAKDSHGSHYRGQMLKFWISDKAWIDKKNDLKYLVEIFLDNIGCFENTNCLLAAKVLLLKKAFPNNYELNQNQELLTREVLRNGNVSHELKEYLSKDVHFLVKIICLAEASNSDMVELPIYKDWYMRLVINKAFTKMLVDISPCFSEQRAVRLILLSLPCDIQNASDYEECVDYIIGHSHEVSELESVLHSFKERNQITEKLAKAITLKIDLIDCRKTRFKLAIKALSNRHSFPFDCFLETLTKSLKTFSTLDSLIEALKEVDISVRGWEEDRFLVSKGVEDLAAELCKNREDFHIFLDSGYFKNEILAWRWYFRYNPVQDFSEIQSDLPRFKQIFSPITPGRYSSDLAKALVELWKSKPFSDTPAEIFFSFVKAQPNDHPDWKKTPLALKIDFTISGVLEFDKDPRELISSLKDGFSESWILEKWTASKYLEQIMPVKDKYFVDNFASLAMGMI